MSDEFSRLDSAFAYRRRRTSGSLRTERYEERVSKDSFDTFSPSIQRDVPAEWSEKRDHTPLQPRRDAKTCERTEKTHRLTSGASFPPRLLISWMIEVVVVMLQTREGSEVAPERECERWNGNKRFRGGGTRRKTARENGRLRWV